MRSLRRPYLFAQGNYPAGTDPWSNQPKQIAISDSDLATGKLPNTPVFPEELAYLESLKADMLTVQAHGALQRWRRYQTDVGAAQTATHLAAMLPVRSFDTNGERGRVPVMLGRNPALRLSVAATNDGSVIEIPRIVNPGSAIAPITSASRGAAGEVMYTDNATAGINFSVDHSLSFAVQAWGSDVKVAVHYAAGSTTPYITLDASGRTSHAATIAGLTASTALPGVFTLVSGVNAVAEFADDTGLNVVLAARVNTDTVCSLWHSSDGGASFTRVQNLTGTVANVVYSKALGIFVSWDTSGVIMTSGTGVVWSSISTSGTPAHGLVSAPKTLAAIGPAIAKLWTHTLELGGATLVQHGIAYTFDLGANWNTWAFGDITNAGATPSKIYGINNRAYVLEATGLWVSDPLAAPAAEF